MVSSSKQSLNASPSTMTSKSSEWTLFNTRETSSGKWCIRICNTSLFYQSTRFLSTKSHWRCALSTTESPMDQRVYNSFTLMAKITSGRSRVLGCSLTANSKDHLPAWQDMVMLSPSRRCRMAGQPMETSALSSAQKESHYMWIHWQRWVMWVDGKRTLGNCKMQSTMEKARYSCQVHAHSLVSFKQLNEAGRTPSTLKRWHCHYLSSSLRCSKWFREWYTSLWSRTN
jgi:hypothetical protein